MEILIRLVTLLFASNLYLSIRFSAGSVTGAPKKSTVQIIQKAEKEPRGYYTGVFGYFDGKEFDCAVMIRFIEENSGRKYFRSGGGITVFSNPEILNNTTSLPTYTTTSAFSIFLVYFSFLCNPQINRKKYGNQND